MGKKNKKNRFGDLLPHYNFSLNPYPEMRFSRCPDCETKTGQRKLPLLIHVDPHNLIALNYTNRYCRRCNMLIGHKDEIEHFLTELFMKINPENVGNGYLIIGTLEKKTWRENMHKAKTFAEIQAHTSDFKSYQEIRMTMGGWFRAEPPVMEPPESVEWVKGS
ncbi:MAG: hypothetical protein ACE5I1_23655 [bacterium]